MLEIKTAALPSQDQKAELLPARVFEIEISNELPLLHAFHEETGKIYQRACCMIRLHTQPLGMIELPFVDGRALPVDYAQRIWDIFHNQISEHLQKDGLPVPTQLDAHGLLSPDTLLCIKEREQFLAQAPFVSIIVPTRDHPDYLAACLSALVKLEYPRYEILVVDSAPTTTAAADLIKECYGDDERVHYFFSERAGASRARNLGIEKARGEILAFTDDDAVVDIHWLTELMRAFFRTEKVLCVTGSVCTLQLDTLAQFWFVTYFRGLGDREKMKRIFSPQIVESHMYYKHLMGNMGGSVNMAATAAFLRHIGGFDPALGPGTPTHAAEDVEVFIHANMHGGTYIYEPTALVYHLDRPDFAGVEKQIYGYGTSVLVVLLKCIMQYPHISAHFIKYVCSKFFPFVFAQKTEKKVAKEKVPGGSSNAKWGELLGWEEEKRITKRILRQLLKGICVGPFALIKSALLQRNRRQVRANRKSATPLWLSSLTTQRTVDAMVREPDATVKNDKLSAHAF